MIPTCMESRRWAGIVANNCFVDTVCWVALLNQDDQQHKIADEKYKGLMRTGYSFITTTAVLNETANALSEPYFRQAVIEFYNRIQMSARIEIVFVDHALWAEGWKLYEQRPDKGWSLTDCLSIVVMQQQRIKKVLTNDKHFEQAGFHALLRINSIQGR